MPSPTQPFGWQFLNTIVADNSLQFMDFALPDGYTRYCLELTEIVLASDDITCFLGFSDDDNVSFEADTSDYEWNMFVSTATTWSGDDETSLTAAIHLWSSAFTVQLGSAAGEFNAWTIWIDGALNSSLQTLCRWQGAVITDDGTSGIMTGSGNLQAVGEVNGVRFMAESGNIESGEGHLFGLNVPSS